MSTEIDVQDFFDSGTKAAPAEVQYGASSFPTYDQNSGEAVVTGFVRIVCCHHNYLHTLFQHLQHMSVSVRDLSSELWTMSLSLPACLDVWVHL